MAQKAFQEQSLPSAPSTPPSIIDDLFGLTASRDLDIMLGKALRMTLRILGAEAGSILFSAHPLKNIQSGAFRPEAVTHIERWEDTIGKRLQNTEWKIPATSSPPISEVVLPHNKLMLVNVPLLQDSKVVGSLSLVLPPNQTLQKQQKDLLARIAKGLGQIASLIADMDLAGRRLHQISVFYDVGQALVTTFDIGHLLTETMELATNLIDAGAASIMLIDEDKQDLVFKAGYGGSSQTLRHQRIPLNEGIAGWVIRNGSPVIANDARSDSRFSIRVDVRTGFLTQSIAAVPLEVKGRIIGVLEVLNKYSGTGFNQEDIQLMHAIATQAAIALENARLYEQVCQERDRLIEIQEKRRQEIVRNLEDGPRQLLSAISMGLDHLEQLSTSASPEVMNNQIRALHNLVHQANHSMHNTLFNLHPLLLETRGLIATCKEYVDQIEGYTIHFRHNVDKIHYNEKTSKTIFAIVHEAINNCKQHANAEHIWLWLEQKDDYFVVTIRDDGQGFDPKQLDKAIESQPTFGLSTIKKQAHSIQAQLQIKSKTEQAGQGTTIQLTLPWLSQSNETINDTPEFIDSLKDY